MGSWLARKKPEIPADAELEGAVQVPAPEPVQVAPPTPRERGENAGIGRYVLLIGALLLWILGAFFAWQAWLVHTEQDDLARIDAARDAEVDALGRFVTDARTRLQQALASEAVTSPLAESWDSGREAAIQAMRQAVPDLAVIDFHRADITDVLATDFAKIGYARSAMLVQASRTHEPAPAQSVPGENGKRLLAFALPVTRADQTLAFAWAGLPLEPLLGLFPT